MYDSTLDDVTKLGNHNISEVSVHSSNDSKKDQFNNKIRIDDNEFLKDVMTVERILHHR